MIGILIDGKEWYLKLIKPKSNTAKWLLVAEEFDDSHKNDFLWLVDGGMLKPKSQPDPGLRLRNGTVFVLQRQSDVSSCHG